MVTRLWLWRSILFKLSFISLIHSFRKSFISITFASDTSSSMLYSLSTGKESTMSYFVERPSNMYSFLDILTMGTFGIEKVSILCDPEAVSERGLLTCSVSKTFQNRRSWLDICLFCLKMRHQYGFMNAHMMKKTAKRYNSRLLYRSFTLVPLLIFENGLISILTHGFSKTRPPQFLNNKSFCLPKYSHHYILLPLHLPIYFIWCSFTTTLFSLLIGNVLTHTF